MKAMRRRIALQKRLARKSTDASVLFREAFGVRTHHRVALSDFVIRASFDIRH
jgi:hypothetical protein